ncbi:MAG: hypothetical protein HYX90_01545 [Chloroflexi bacterium]|nr:hypothetical protein [Chloroflexota bacterium]
MEKVDQVLLRSIDGLQTSDRLARMRELYFTSQAGVASERVALAMEAWKETEGELPEQRQAKRVKKVLEGIPIVIHPGQLLVGSLTKYFRGASPCCDYDGSYLGQLMGEGKGQISLGGPADKGNITDEDWRVLAEAARFFKGKTVADTIRETIRKVDGTWYDDVVEAGGTQHYAEQRPPFLAVPIWAQVRTRGLRGIIKEAEERIRDFKEKRELDSEKLDFWEAVIISCQATIDFARRYSQLAREMAAKEQDLTRRAELEEIARVCGWVPENPARTFHEALQGMVFVDLALWMEAGGGHSTSGWGLVDQELYPYFRSDLQEGRLTLDKAAELVGCLMTYTACREWVRALSWRGHIQKGAFGSLPVGGPAADGEDASNELSYLILHMAGLLRYAEPHIPFRWHKGSPRWLMLKAIDTNCKVKGGIPQFQNSEHIVDYWTKRGISLENARTWVSYGCANNVAGDARTGIHLSFHNAALPIDLVLHNGVASATGKRIGPETGDPRSFETFDQFYGAFKSQCEFMFRRVLWLDAHTDKIMAEQWRTPLASALAPRCLEKGKDFTRGGLPHYACWMKADRGIIPAADSLMAVKKLVFEEKKLTMGELIEVLDANFQGERGEKIRQMCLAAPKYGNDLDEPDEMVRDVAKLTASIICSEKNIFGWPYAVLRDGQAWHVANGKKLAALPNGRKAREPLVDGSLSPMHGMDTQGPTAMLKSALKADFREATAGVLNVKFPTSLFQSQETREKLVDLTERFLGAGGTYVQYNLLDRNDLLAAKRHPEKYRDLIVRVGGYSAYFVTLSPEVQDDIIRRTEQSL